MTLLDRIENGKLRIDDWQDFGEDEQLYVDDFNEVYGDDNIIAKGAEVLEHYTDEGNSMAVVEFTVEVIA